MDEKTSRLVQTIIMVAFVITWAVNLVGRYVEFIPDPVSDELAELKGLVEAEVEHDNRLPYCTIEMIKIQVECTTQDKYSNKKNAN